MKRQEELLTYLISRTNLRSDLTHVLMALINAATVATEIAEYDPPDRRFSGYRALRQTLDALAALNFVNEP